MMVSQEQMGQKDIKKGKTGGGLCDSSTLQKFYKGKREVGEGEKAGKYI